MDINKENEFVQENEAQEAVNSEESVDTVSAENVSESEYSTVSVAQEDIDEELTRYGLTEGVVEEESVAEEEPQKRKRIVQKPIIIAAVALLAAIILVVGTYFVYNTFLKPGISGTWVMADDSESGIYFVFDKDGNIKMDGGNIQYFGTYTMEKNEEGQDIMKTDFYLFGYYGGEATVTYSSDKKTMTLGFPSGEVQMNKAELPKIKSNPQEITHASADELGIDKVNIDESILGSWKEEMYGTYTFNDDGTGSYYSEYNFNQYYGFGYGITYEFKYTVYEDKILITLEYFNGLTEDDEINYYVDGNNLVLNGLGYAKVTE